MNVFVYDNVNNRLEINEPEILLIKEFKSLFDKDKTKTKQIAFFGGSFTGLEMEDQVRFLKVANEYIEKGLVKDIRISTRPDYISELILKILKGYNVSVIELGVQSMDNEVLLKAKRGHTSEDVVKASELINKYGFELGHQVMVGLPESTLEKELETKVSIEEVDTLIENKITELAGIQVVEF